eukprot:1632324-Alexandrium_andersonii.AAC.1
MHARPVSAAIRLDPQSAPPSMHKCSRPSQLEQPETASTSIHEALDGCGVFCAMARASSKYTHESGNRR